MTTYKWEGVWGFWGLDVRMVGGQGIRVSSGQGGWGSGWLGVSGAGRHVGWVVRGAGGQGGWGSGGLGVRGGCKLLSWTLGLFFRHIQTT